MTKISPVNVFLPAAEIGEIERFAGRTPELQTLARALESEGVHIVMFGNRGVGKSSLARQLEAMAQNGPAVLERVTHPRPPRSTSSRCS
jgi:predicted ATPase